MSNPSESLSGLDEKLRKFSSDFSQFSHYNAVVSQPESCLYRYDRQAEGFLASRTIGIKYNIAAKGWPLTCASNILPQFVSPYHATAVQRILDEGGVIVGKTNHDEFAMGSSRGPLRDVPV